MDLNLIQQNYRLNCYIWINNINCCFLFNRKKFYLNDQCYKKMDFFKIKWSILIPLMLWFVLSFNSIYDHEYIES
jgi:hypothetical protein